MPEDQHSWFEYQAYAFAGLILVPNEKFISKIDSIKLEMKAHNLDLNNLGDREREVIIEVLASYFFVSKEVIRRRLDKEEEIAKIKLI